MLSATSLRLLSAGRGRGEAHAGGERCSKASMNMHQDLDGVLH